jgi:hypothetical protein
MIGEVRNDAKLAAEEMTDRAPVAEYERTNYPTSTEVVEDPRFDPREPRVISRVDDSVDAARLDSRDVVNGSRELVPEERVVDRDVVDRGVVNRGVVAEQRVDPAAGYDQPGQLFPSNELTDLRARWDKAQIGFVDEPRSAVKQADELVATVVKRLSEQFAAERSDLEHQWDRGDSVNTEDLRLALRRYRTFFDRLLAF